MPKFIDIHTGMKGVTQQQLQKSHQKDHELEDSESWTADKFITQHLKKSGTRPELGRSWLSHG